MIKATTDLSPAFGPIRDQGQRPTCLAFAASDLHAHAQQSDHLSVDYLGYHTALSMAGIWQPGMGFSIDHLLLAVAAPGQPSELAYPYDPLDQQRPFVTPPSARELHTKAARHPVMNLADIAPTIRSGSPVGVVIAVTPSLHYPVNGVVQYETAVFPDQFHAMGIIGVGKSVQDGSRHYLARNSWGSNWGQGGYAWIPENHLYRHTIRAFMI